MGIKKLNKLDILKIKDLKNLQIGIEKNHTNKDEDSATNTLMIKITIARVVLKICDQMQKTRNNPAFLKIWDFYIMVFYTPKLF